MNQLAENRKFRYVCGQKEKSSFGLSGRKQVSSWLKGKTAAVMLFFLSLGIEVLCEKDERVKEEINRFPEGFICGIGCGYHQPALYLSKEAGEICRIKESSPRADLMINFKHIDAAFPVLTGRKSVARSYAEHGFSLKGDISEGMIFVRCVDIAEAYLFPKMVTKRILKEVPKKRMGLLHTYACVFGKLIKDKAKKGR